MAEMDEFKSAMRKRLDVIQRRHQQQTELQVEDMRNWLYAEVVTPAPAELQQQLQHLDEAFRSFRTAKPAALPGQAFSLASLHTAGQFDAMDAAFCQALSLPASIAGWMKNTPVIITETPADFIKLLFEWLHLAPQEQAALQPLLERAMQQAALQPENDQFLGYCLAGKGCLVNGGLLTAQMGSSQQRLLLDPPIKRRMVEVIIREKYGRGFLAAARQSSGLDQAPGEIPAEFWAQLSPVLPHLQQHPAPNSYSGASLLQEGWLDWLKHFWGGQLTGEPAASPLEITQVHSAISQQANSSIQGRQVTDILLFILNAFFGQKNPQLMDLLRSVLSTAEIKDWAGDLLIKLFQRTLPGWIGEALFDKIRHKQGEAAAPLAAWIAASAAPMPKQNLPASLIEWWQQDATRCPDVRLAMLSQYPASSAASLADFLRQAEEEMKISLPGGWKSGVGFSSAAEKQPEAPIFPGAPTTSPVNAEIVLTGSPELKVLDEILFDTFQLGSYYRLELYSYPTVLCQSLEEFYQAYFLNQDQSPLQIQVRLKRLVAEARQKAEEGSGVLGVNLPGSGCYINLWLIEQLVRKVHSAETEERIDQMISDQIRSTLVHEKLGHGFIGLFTALGKSKTRLDLDRVEIANKFGVRLVDDHLSAMRTAQHSLIYTCSQYLEEGWATWVESWFAENVFHTQPHPKHPLAKLEQALQMLDEKPEHVEFKQALRSLLPFHFKLKASEAASIQYALVKVNQLIEQHEEIEATIGGIFGQPLRYVLGEMLLQQAEANLGKLCVPYVTLLAGNVTYDFEQTGLADLAILLDTDWRIHPDVRLAVISQRCLENKNSLEELVYLTEQVLGLAIPQELRVNK